MCTRYLVDVSGQTTKCLAQQPLAWYEYKQQPCPSVGVFYQPVCRHRPAVMYALHNPPHAINQIMPRCCYHKSTLQPKNMNQNA